MSPTEEQHRFRVILCFALVYVLWGSTYLPMRVAVRDLPPFVVGATRYLVSGPIMLAGCWLAGRNIRIKRQAFWRLLIIGTLLLSIGNMGVVWSEEYVTSGMAALIVAIVPLWVVVLETSIFREARIRLQGVIGLVLGIAGVLALLWPRLGSGTQLGHRELVGTAILVVGSMAWALGSVFSSRWEIGVDVFTSAAWQMTLGGLVNAVIAFSSGQFHRAAWTVPAITSVAYLVICGSWIGFSAYIWLLEHVPTPRVATYTYVNPLVAVFLGWLLLQEKLDKSMVLASLVIICAVALVNTSRGAAGSGGGVFSEPSHAAPETAGE